MSKYLHIGICFSGSPKTKALEPAFAAAKDWLRYDSHCWIIYTDESPLVWRDRIKSYLSDKDDFLIFEVNWTNFAGWGHDLVREWVNKVR